VTCPHCGLPNPTAKEPPQRASVQESQGIAQVDQSADRSVQPGPLWPVFLWTASFFFLGVLLDNVLEAADWISGDLADFVVAYRLSWFSATVAYMVGATGLLIGLGIRQRGRGSNPYRWLAGGVALLLGTGVGVLLAQNTPEGGDSVTVSSPPVAETPTTAGAPITSTTDELERSLYCIENWVTDTGCDGETPLGSLVGEYYWQGQFVPLLDDVFEAVENGDESRARIACELAKDDRDAVAARIPSWETTPFRELTVHLFDEIEVLLAACATGEWSVVDDSLARVNGYVEEACSKTIYFEPGEDGASGSTSFCMAG
jgi:hypothetical protein